MVQKGHRYCYLLMSLIKKFDLFELIAPSHIEELCTRVSIVNGGLQKCYNIIFTRGLTKKQALKKMMKITDKQHRPLLDPNKVSEVYDKFQTIANGLRPNNTKGGSDKKITKKASQLPELNKAQKELVEKTFDMMEVLLISLSLLPIAGWTFDFPLFIYAISHKKYTLAMITVLNWYIWSFWLLFGVNMNVGPTLKASYLGNGENLVKKALLDPASLSKLIKDRFLQAKVRDIDGNKYLVDDYGEVYERKVSDLKPIGILNKDQHLLKPNDPGYWDAKDQILKDKLTRREHKPLSQTTDTSSEDS